MYGGARFTSLRDNMLGGESQHKFGDSVGLLRNGIEREAVQGLLMDIE